MTEPLAPNFERMHHGGGDDDGWGVIGIVVLVVLLTCLGAWVSRDGERPVTPEVPSECWFCDDACP